MIAVIKYNAGNIGSLTNALKRLDREYIVTDNAEEILTAEKVIFPGVGEAGSAMQYLRERGLDSILKQVQVPFLGICLGLQLMCEHSEEGDTPCLGIFPEKVKRFPTGRKIPHMGWNDFNKLDGPLFKTIDTTDDVYFVHSYCAAVGPDTVAETTYGIPFSSALQRENYYAVQFHPEKSALVGRRILENFIAL